MTNTTDSIATLRRQIAEVLERHKPVESALITDMRRVCPECNVYSPCDAASLARQMTTLLDGLEEINGMRNDDVCQRHPWSCLTEAVHIVNAAIASAAQEQRTHER